MEFDIAVQLIMVLITVWTLYVNRRVSPPAASKKKSRKGSFACVEGILKKKPSELSTLNSACSKKSRCATGRSTSSKKALELHILFSEKKISIDAPRIAPSKKVLSVNKCGQEKPANIGPLKKVLRNPFLGLSKKSPPQTVFGWGDKKRLGLGVYA